MAEKSLFFNAFPNENYETGYDRNYSADDISDWLSIVCESGVVKTNNEAGTGIPQGLKVVAAEGMNVSVNVGKATIRGKGYINNSLLTLPIATAPTGTTPRYDLVILRQDNTQSVDARKNYVLIASIDHLPTINDLTRNSDIYDLLLGYITVQPNATSIQQTYISDTRGDEELCPWFTAVKGYDDYYDAIIQRFEYDTTLSGSSLFVVTDLPSDLYNDKYSLINVYVNGLKEESDNYTIDATNQYIKITFSSSKNAGADVSVVLNNFVDGEGLSSAIDDYNQWVQDVANLQELNEFNYYCNGSTDNVEISNIVNNFLANDGAYYQTLKLNIIGAFGMTTKMSGDGTQANPNKIFSFDYNSGNRRFILDFSNCNNVVLSIENNSYTTIFSGSNIFVKGAAIVANNTTARITAFENTARIRCEDSRFWLFGFSDTMVGSRGTFINCKAEVRTEAGVSYCFYPTQNNVLLVIQGGEYMAHTKDSSSRSAVVGLQYNSAVVMSNVNAPTSAKTGYYQTHAIYHYNVGKITCVGLITTLTVAQITGDNIYGTIALSLYNHVW